MPFELNGRNVTIALFILCGLLVEAIKLIPRDIAPIAVIREAIAPSDPYSVSEKRIKETTAVKRYPPAMATTNQMAPDDHTMDLLKKTAEQFEKDQAKLKADAAAKAKAAKGWHWVYNRKLGKWVWKKKTKKKKDANEIPYEDYAAKDPAKTDTKKPMDGPQSFGGSTPVQSFPLATFGSGAPAPQKILSQQAWEDMLIKTPSLAETKMFIQQYRQGLVTETVFYAVIDKMLKSSNTDAQKYGVYALGEMDSVKSFDRLATEKLSLQTSSPLYQSTTQYLDQYGEIKQLPILAQVLAQPSGTQQVLTVAIEELQTSMQKNLGATVNPSTLSANATHYKPFISVLSQIAANPNSPISNQAQSLLSELQRLTGQTS